jgi:hypothetical protein
MLPAEQLIAACQALAALLNAKQLPGLTAVELEAIERGVVKLSAAIWGT